MSNRTIVLKRPGFALVVGALASVALTTASGQSPTAPSPATPPAAVNSPEQLADRLRRMEEINQTLIRQFSNVANQNEALSRQVQELTKRLDGQGREPGLVVRGATGGADTTAPSLSESAARPSRDPGGGSAGVASASAGAGPVGGVASDNTAPSLSESAARPSRVPGGGTGKASDRVKLNA